MGKDYVRLDISYYCKSCGTELEGDAQIGAYGEICIDLEPCEECNETKYIEGLKDGRDENA